MIKISGLNKSFGGNEVLKNINLSFTPIEFPLVIIQILKPALSAIFIAAPSLTFIVLKNSPASVISILQLVKTPSTSKMKVSILFNLE